MRSQGGSHIPYILPQDESQRPGPLWLLEHLPDITSRERTARFSSRALQPGAPERPPTAAIPTTRLRSNQGALIDLAEPKPSKPRSTPQRVSEVDCLGHDRAEQVVEERGVRPVQRDDLDAGHVVVGIE